MTGRIGGIDVSSTILGAALPADVGTLRMKENLPYTGGVEFFPSCFFKFSQGLPILRDVSSGEYDLDS